MSESVYTYLIDRNDIILGVSDNWRPFADANTWNGAVQPDDVVGRKLWTFIQGLETQHLYQEIFSRVRRGEPSQSIPFRCDSPGERRFLELLVEGGPEGQLQIRSTIVRTEQRSPVNLLDVSAPRSPEVVKLCSMCRKMELSPGLWVEIEEGLRHREIFHDERMPQLSHGLCRPCVEASLAQLRRT